MSPIKLSIIACLLVIAPLAQAQSRINLITPEIVSVSVEGQKTAIDSQEQPMVQEVLTSNPTPNTETKSFSIIGGAAVFHLLGTDNPSAREFHHKWDKSGRLIGTPLIGAESTKVIANRYRTTKYFAGQNSIGSAMGGVAFSRGKRYSHWDLGFALGMYAQDASRFYKKDMATGGLGIGPSVNLVPVLGLEVAYRIGAFGLHTILSPMNSIAYLSLELDFKGNH